MQNPKPTPEEQARREAFTVQPRFAAAVDGRPVQGPFGPDLVFFAVETGLLSLPVRRGPDGVLEFVRDGSPPDMMVVPVT